MGFGGGRFLAKKKKKKKREVELSVKFFRECLVISNGERES